MLVRRCERDLNGCIWRVHDGRGWVVYVIEVVRVVVIVVDFKPGAEVGVATLVDRDEVRQRVASFNAIADPDVVGVRVVEFRRQDPFPESKDAVGLEDRGDAGVDVGQGGGVDGCFGCVGGVKAGFGECLVEFHEVALDETALVAESCFGGHADRDVDVSLVVGDADYAAADEARDLSCGSADAAADIEDEMVRLQVHHVCKPVLVEGEAAFDGGGGGGEGGEVEFRGPAIKEGGGYEVIVAVFVSQSDIRRREGFAWVKVRDVLIGSFRARLLTITSLVFGDSGLVVILAPARGVCFCCFCE